MHLGRWLPKAAVQFGDATALRHGDTRVSYARLFERSCRLANALRERGLGPGDPVATLGANSARSVEEITGLALGGFVRAPLHSRNALDLHLEMLRLLEARAVITDAAEYERLAPRLHEVPTLAAVLVDGGADDYEGAIAAASAADPRVHVDGDAPLHVTFTAGSTGRPKAVVQTHGSWSSVVAEHLIILPRLTGADVYLAAGPMSHAASVLVFALVSVGASIVIMPRWDPTEAAALIDRHGVTITQMVPTMLQMLCDERGRPFESLRTAFITGAPITETAIRNAHETLGPIVHIGYGQSEAVPISILTPEDIALGLTTHPEILRSSGRPTPRTVVRVTDENLVDVPVGTRGEVVVDAPGNMQRYWGDPEETARRFTPEGYVRTRDAGRLDACGYLYLADRLEDVIVSGGFNIAPGELENALAAHPAVREAVVVGIPHPHWGETPRAVVVLHDGHTASESELIAWARERVGSMKKPTSVVFRDQPLPLNAAGKVSRRTVREQELSAADASA